MIHYWTRVACVLVLAVTIAAGCSKSGTPGTVKAGGRVTYGGQGVAGATVTFVPQSGKGAAVAMTDPSGNFQLMTAGSLGALPGSYKVTVTKTQESGGAAPANDPEAARKADMAGLKPAAAQAAAPKNALPEKYAAPDKTPLTFEVKSSGKNDFQLELTN